MKFKRLDVNDAEYIIEVIDEIFGYRKMLYNEKEDILEFEKPIWMPEAPEVYFQGAGMAYEESGEICLKFKMYNEEDDYIYYINGIEV